MSTSGSARRRFDVRERHVAVLGAVDDERRRGDAVERDVHLSRLQQVVVGARHSLLVREGRIE
jgi:hypothetical protein